MMAAAQPPFALHPAWQWFVDVLDKVDKVDNTPDDHSKALELAWRRAACREPDAQAPSEKQRGGLLKLLQSEDSPRRLVVPPGTRGTMNAYMQQTEVVSSAVGAHLRTTTDPFYAEEPAAVTNYGGRGGSQQLWWCGSARGWRGSAPSIQCLVVTRRKRAFKGGRQTNMPAALIKQETGKRRQRTRSSRDELAEEGELAEEDIAGLPVLLNSDGTPAATPALVKQGLVDVGIDSSSMVASTDSETNSSSVWTESEQDMESGKESDSSSDSDGCLMFASTDSEVCSQFSDSADTDGREQKEGDEYCDAVCWECVSLSRQWCVAQALSSPDNARS